jgi:fumarylacetoacetate (FAA) hydrolase
MLEILNKGEAKTPFLEFGDEARITMQDETGRNIFGDICQKLQQYQSSPS